MLCVIVTIGLVFVFFDFTLIQLIGMMLLIVIVMPFLLGIVSITEVRDRLGSIAKTGFLKRLNEIKIFEKSPLPGQKPSQKIEKVPPKTSAQQSPSKSPDASGGFRLHLTSFISSLGSLGTILREKTKQGKKVEDINKLLDKTVSEKVVKPAVSPALPVTASSGGSAGATGGGNAPETDPFLSLSNDDFDPSLLDGLDDEPAAFPSTDGNTSAGTAGPLPEPELSIPSMDEETAAPVAGEGIPESESGLDAFKGLDSNEALDTDFGDLDDLSLDDVEMDDDMGGGSTVTEPAPEALSPPPQPVSAPPAESGAVKTAWIPSDAPKGAEIQEDQIGVQSDMASFASASGGGSDEDLLSSIASDVKTVKKEKDVSLLRELKDFKAPADEIENELKETFGRMSTIQKPKDSSKSPADGMK